MRQALYTLCALLLATAPLGVAHAAETLDEKVYDPGQRQPAVDAPAPDVRVTPGQAVPGGGDTIIVVPGTQGTPGQMLPEQAAPQQVVPNQVVPGQVIPGQLTPSQNSTTPEGSPRVLVPDTVRPETVRPDTGRPDTGQPGALQKENPTIVTPPAAPTVPATPVPIPQLPKAPGTEKKDVIVTPVQPAQQGQSVTPKDRTVPVQPKTEERVILTPADFLPMTPNTQEKGKPAPKAETKPGVKPDLKPDPKKTAPGDKAKAESPKEAKPDSKPDPNKDAKLDPKKDPKADPVKDAKPDSQKAPNKPKDKPTAEKKKGDVLRIPPDAAKTGKKDFLEGCWKGRVTGNDGREVRDNMGSRVCFDANGNGKHHLYDPVKKETCVGPAKGVVSGDNLLRVDYEKMQCPSGKTWYPQGDRYMTCRDAGNGAHCSWYFNGSPDVGVRFYRD